MKAEIPPFEDYKNLLQEPMAGQLQSRANCTQNLNINIVAAFQSSERKGGEELTSYRLFFKIYNKGILICMHLGDKKMLIQRNFSGWSSRHKHQK